MFDQSYQQLYEHKQVIALEHNYPCPRCKAGQLKPFGETETFTCVQCHRKFVALNGSRILYPAVRLKIKIAPIFWWDGLHWHLAGTTATPLQNIFVSLMFVLPILTLNAFVFFFNHGHISLNQHFYLNFTLLNGLIIFFMAQIFYLFCWDQNWSNSLAQRKQIRH
jgi:hypothetical protein